MKTPQQHQIDHWLVVSRKSIAQTEQDNKEGYYEKENIPLQSVYTGTAMDYAGLARAKFLNGDSLASVQREFATAAQCIIKSFTMAYDDNDPDYVGDQWPPKNPHYTGHKDSPIKAQWSRPGYGHVCWADVGETDAIEGVNWALMAADVDRGRQLAHWYQDRKDGYKMDPDVNRYAHALKHALLNEADKGSALLQATLDEYTAKPPKNGGDMNYFTLSLTLAGILTGNETLFNQGLEQQLTFYEKVMIPSEDLWDSDERYICDHAVALANLAIHYHLKVTVAHDLLPTALLIQLNERTP